MSAVHALKLARAAGVRIGIDGDALMLDADAAPPSAVLDLLARHKAQVIALLRPGGDGWSGEDWRAFADCVAEWLNRNPVRSPPGRCHGCGEAEHDQDPLLPFGTEPTGHAWLHGRCWSAWHTSRKAEAVAALSAFEIYEARKSP